MNVFNNEMRQCKSCPWIKGSKKEDIPNYDAKLHEKLKGTIQGVEINMESLRIMACHFSEFGDEQTCVGWMHNQLGEGNNIALRIQALSEDWDHNYELVGDQVNNFDETFH
jgi:hypothetical protein